MLYFKTDTLIPLQAFDTFGLNAKMKTSPIGFFGTGLKYVVAIVLRLGGTIRVFRGTDEYEFYVKEGTFRDKNFSFVRMRKKTRLGKWGRSKALPYTLELGKNWKPWMATRELEGNTRDEDGTSGIISDFNEEQAQNGVTWILVDCPAMEQAYVNDEIFLPEQVRDVELTTATRDVKIYAGKSKYVYMNGIRVYEPSVPCNFTYDVQVSLELTEDRTPLYNFMLRHYVLQALRGLENRAAAESLFGLKDGQHWETLLDFDETENAVKASPVFRSALSRAVSNGSGHTFSRAATYHEKTSNGDLGRTIKVGMTKQDWVDIVNGRQISEAQRAEILVVLRRVDPDLKEIGVVAP